MPDLLGSVVKLVTRAHLSHLGRVARKLCLYEIVIYEEVGNDSHLHIE